MRQNVWQCKRCGSYQPLLANRCGNCGASLIFHGVAMTVDIGEKTEDPAEAEKAAERIKTIKKRLSFFERMRAAENSRAQNSKDRGRGFDSDLLERENALRLRAEYFAKQEEKAKNKQQQ